MLFEKTPSDVQSLLPIPIKQLGLKLEGSPIERYVEQLFKELEAKGLQHFRPAFYLTSEWGCPSEEPIIGVPFSRNFVRHIAGWYAQKHPDEDFAETFAVWLTPRSNWREKYKNWPAIKKLRYVDRVADSLASTPPVRPLG